MLVGNIITVSPAEVAAVAVLYGAVGLLHWLCRRPFFLISTDPEAAFRDGWRVRLWDFVFYASFGLVVTSSVRIAGVLLVFAYLIVPALAGTALGTSIGSRLLIGWGFGTLVSVVGIAASATLDLPTGATVVCVFGAALLLGWAFARASRRSAPARPGAGARAVPPRPTRPRARASSDDPPPAVRARRRDLARRVQSVAGREEPTAGTVPGEAQAGGGSQLLSAVRICPPRGGRTRRRHLHGPARGRAARLGASAPGRGPAREGPGIRVQRRRLRAVGGQAAGEPGGFRAGGGRGDGRHRARARGPARPRSRPRVRERHRGQEGRQGHHRAGSARMARSRPRPAAGRDHPGGAGQGGPGERGALRDQRPGLRRAPARSRRAATSAACPSASGARSWCPTPPSRTRPSAIA